MENPLFHDAATKVIAKAIEDHREYQDKGYIGPSLAKWIRDALANAGYDLDDAAKKPEGYVEGQDDRLCICGHKYYRHFDTYEDMEPVGCKYCGCEEFTAPESLTDHDMVRAKKAASVMDSGCKNPPDIEEIKDAQLGIQSTDDPRIAWMAEELEMWADLAKKKVWDDEQRNSAAGALDVR